MEKHINIIAALQIGLSIFNLLVALLIFTVLKLVGGFVDDANANTILSIIADVFAIVLIIISVPGILTLVLSIIEIFSFPFGTAIGIYSIWALIQPETVAAFGESKESNF